MLAAEVVDPHVAYPRALYGTLALTTALYVAPLAACVAAVGGWHDWREGQFALANGLLMNCESVANQSLISHQSGARGSSPF